MKLTNTVYPVLLQAQQAHKELLQAQLASISAVGRRVTAASAAGAAKQRRATLSALRANQLRQAAAGAAEAGQELDDELAALADAMSAWVDMAEAGAAGDDWLLCTADAASYAARDAEMQEIISRCGARGHQTRQCQQQRATTCERQASPCVSMCLYLTLDPDRGPFCRIWTHPMSQGYAAGERCRRHGAAAGRGR